MENTIVTMKELITDLKDLRGKDVKIFGQPTTLNTYDDIENELMIDTITVLERLEKNVVESIEVYHSCEVCQGQGVIDKWDDEEECEIEEECEKCDGMGYYYTDESPQETLNEMWRDGILEDIKSDNTYNWQSCLTNDLNWNMYENKENGDIYVELSAHRFGDIRGNYTNVVILKFDEEYEFLSAIVECSKHISIEINDKSYSVDVDPLAEGYEIYNEDGTYVTTLYVCDMEELKEELEEFINDNKEENDNE